MLKYFIFAAASILVILTAINMLYVYKTRRAIVHLIKTYGGSLSGITLEDVVSLYGDPLTTTVLENGSKVCCWKKPFFKMTLFFNHENVCIGKM